MRRVALAAALVLLIVTDGRTWDSVSCWTQDDQLAATERTSCCVNVRTKRVACVGVDDD